jgi:hypothetical protein
MRMRDLASEALALGSALPDAYRRYFLALVVVFGLMVAKPP